LKILPACAASILCLTSAAFAGPAADTVRSFYTDNLGYEADVSTREYFIDPALSQLDANDELIAEGELGCISFGLAVDGQDFDADEIANTLELEENLDSDVAIVIARFMNFGEEREIEWWLREVDGYWRVSDIYSITSDWRLSDFDCSE
jgi:hypothetical protein